MFFTDPYEAVRNLSLDNPPELIQIGEAGEENVEPDIQWERTAYQISGDDIFWKIKGKSEIDDIEYDKWLYIPFNFMQSTRVDILLDNLKKECKRQIIIVL